jgi:hypothetical protein
MKTIRNKKTGEIQRVEDRVANNTVGSTWEYCPKSEYKKTREVPTQKQKVDDSKKEKTVSKKQESRMKLKEKQRQYE